MLMIDQLKALSNRCVFTTARQWSLQLIQAQLLTSSNFQGIISHLGTTAHITSTETIQTNTTTTTTTGCLGGCIA